MKDYFIYRGKKDEIVVKIWKVLLANPIVSTVEGPDL